MPKPKKIINDPANAVEEFIRGLLLQYPNRLAKLANHHVVLKADIASSSQVHLLSGGGSGHEPSHAGWIGNGMLSGAICGGIFASPSVAAVLAAIRAAKNDKGVLLVVKNYTGDRLNFGMACEKANAEGIHCQMVVAADDCALERTKGITGARGVAGTVLIHKIAGAAAAQGKSLQEVANWANAVSARMGTVGVAMDSVTVPGADAINDRLDENTIEIGLGIHGEAGLRQSPLLTAKEIAQELITTIQKYGRTSGADGEIVPMFQPKDELCILVNNLGGTSNFEMSILAQSCVELLEGAEFGAQVTRVLVGSYMTSFDMHGASLTILNLSGAPDGMVALLDAATDAPAWGVCDTWNRTAARASATEIPEVVVAANEVSAGSLPTLTVPNFEAVAKQMIQAAAQKLIDEEPTLTKYDTIVGDGDCGITMKRGATELLKRLESGDLKTEHPVSMFAAIADAVSASMGGTSGVLLELMFRKMGSSLAREETVGVDQLQAILGTGTDAIILYGGANVGSRTMLDALVPASNTLVSSKSLADSAAKAKEGADNTASLKAASAGRSNYLSEETLEGTPDPGAIAVALVLEEIAKLV
ncbi:Triokinase/FMN cyclase [Seminavis robusta]|uniref:Triokinase/FMN cyclase n=1 Tax=Seminavis robusta TaxID=568900 RepID=A0A9N8EUG7_9STRA|nr:Triokinase/FMN cyclase [Seminavis robusta]|eukprot:Sro1797_g298150.1 Triokinase/FMN cyclase (590) ;mRNA; r:4656-6545